MGKIYEKTVWVDEITPLDADNMNKIEDAIESLSSMAVSNISDGKGEGSVVQTGNVASGDGSAAFGVGNTTTYDGQFVAGRYSKAGKNGMSSDQPDDQLIVRIGAGPSAEQRWTVFSIDDNGTTCMSSAGVNTNGIVTSWNVINKEYADNRYSRNGIGNTTTYDGQFVTGKYSKAGQNGLSSDQTDEQLIVRIGAGTSASNPRTVFSIDNNGTTCMVKAAVKTAAISDPWNVINKEYADAHYAPIGGEYSAKEKPWTMTMEKTKMCIWDQGDDPVFDASTGLFKSIDFGGNIVERTLEQVVQSGSSGIPITFKPLYSTKKREETWGTMTDYYFPIWFSVKLTENTDGTVTLNGTMHYIAK